MRPEGNWRPDEATRAGDRSCRSGYGWGSRVSAALAAPLCPLPACRHFRATSASSRGRSAKWHLYTVYTLMKDTLSRQITVTPRAAHRTRSLATCSSRSRCRRRRALAWAAAAVAWARPRSRGCRPCSALGPPGTAGQRGPAQMRTVIGWSRGKLSSGLPAALHRAPPAPNAACTAPPLYIQLPFANCRHARTCTAPPLPPPSLAACCLATSSASALLALRWTDREPVSQCLKQTQFPKTQQQQQQWVRCCGSCSSRRDTQATVSRQVRQARQAGKPPPTHPPASSHACAPPHFHLRVRRGAADVKGEAGALWQSRQAEAGQCIACRGGRR